MALADDMAYGRLFLPLMKSIIGRHLIGEAPYEEDTQRNTDLIVLRLEPVRIACRVRRHAYYANATYRGQFTLRSGRPNDVKTELAKVIEGWGDYILYGFADATDSFLEGWLLGDLRVFRLWFAGESARLPAGHVPGEGRQNGDGSSSFRAFTTDDLPAHFIVAQAGLDIRTPMAGGAP